MLVVRPACLIAPLVLIAVVAPAAARAGERPAPPDDAASREAAVDPPAPRSHGPFDRNAIGVEVGASLLPEVWNLNERREWLLGGTFAVWWACRESLALRGEVQVTKVYQAGPRHGLVQGLTPVVRWRLGEWAPWSLFVDLGAGVSWSDTRVPPRGTRFNYLTVVGSGLTRRLGRQSQVVVGARWLHLSNAGREGRDRNPDIEAVGPYAAISVGF